MRTTLLGGLAAATLALALAGCASTTTAPAAPPAPVDSAPAAPSGLGGDTLSTASTSLGTIVTDTSGRTVYVYDKDTQGAQTTACTGPCLSSWPLLLSDTARPSVMGVTGTVATIPAAGGKFQVTLNGWPLYYFAGDAAAGDTAGQGVGGIWWVVGADGAKIGGGSAAGSGDGW